ncbi:hypothetical protein PGTUg99_030019 [Puccinia graminis f. sp. tritici]|uniref:Methyltransferase domain-containing protein n=1 Tax=Puccinia graminis f. sp. tritici TaxID=56615 RepID=A0A5B0RTL5_PUCGR|nr:hypothetical protein PGTUg99_030019 [Puccinia graminis f. sp. tritici]
MAYLQEAYLLVEPGDHEVSKHDRAHHRMYNSNHLASSSQHETSRIRRLLKKSAPSRRPTVESDPDINPELPVKSPLSRGHGASAVGHETGLDIKPLSKSLGQPLSRLTRSASRRSLVGVGGRFIPDNTLAGNGPSIKRAVTEAKQGSPPATEELSYNHLDPSTSAPSEFPFNTTLPSRSTLSPPVSGNTRRQPRLSISKNMIQYCLSTPKHSPLAWPPIQNGASQTSLHSAESEANSDTGPLASPKETHYGSKLIFNNFRKLTLNSKRSPVASSKSCLPADLPPHPPLFSDALPLSRADAVRRQDHLNEALDHTWFNQSRGERYHPHLRNDVPYWMSYGPEIMDYHILMQYSSAILQGTSPFQLMASPPEANISKREIRRVLDVGCGPSATWCVGVLRETSGVEVVGLDICPLLLNLDCLERRVSENLSFVKHDFSDCTLPFETASFDYVHASFIAAGIPEHKWPSMLEEMTRVLKRQGTLELLECNTLIADPIKAKDPTYLDDGKTQGTSFCRVPTASASNQSSVMPREIELLKESVSEVYPTTVKEMVDKLLESHFISPYPLSLLPTEVSNLTTAMKRPLAKKFIRFPSDLQSFVDTQTKSPDRAHTFIGNDSQQLVAKDHPIAKAAANECMGMLLLHSHINAMYSNKEISWCDLWLPAIHCETTAMHVPNPLVKRTRPTPNRMPPHFGLHLNQNRRTKSNSPIYKVKSEHSDQSVFETTSDKAEASNSKSIVTLHEGQTNSHENVKSMSHSNLNTDALAGNFNLDLPLDPRDSVQHQHEPEKMDIDSLRVSHSMISPHRKKFDQTWNKWKDDLNCHSLGISKLLELRFGWTCTMDLENHKALYEHYEFYQQQLAQCESRIAELRLKLQEIKFVHIDELEASLDEDLHSNPPSSVRGASPVYTHRPHSFEYETSSEGHEDFEHINFARSSIGGSSHDTATSTDPRQLMSCSENPILGYGSNVVHHELDSQSLEELGFDILKENSNMRPRTRHSSGSTGRIPAGLKDARSLYRKSSVAAFNRHQAESDNEEGFMSDSPISSKVFLSSSKVTSNHIHSKGRETDVDLETEIESLTRQKAEIKKAIQLIQTDLDNVTKRLGLLDPEDYQPLATSTAAVAQVSKLPLAGETDQHQVATPENCDKRSAPAAREISSAPSDEAKESSAKITTNPKGSTRDDKRTESGMMNDLFSPFDKLEFASFLVDDCYKPASLLGQSTQHEANKETNEDLTSRISIFNQNNPGRTSNLSHRHVKNAKDLRFTNVGFGDLRIEKFYSVKKI